MIMLLNYKSKKLLAASQSIRDALEQTAVIIPARNVEKSIGLVLRDLPKVGKVFVVDNGSTDLTSHIAAKNDAYVVHEETAGYGRACRAGIYALRRYNRRLNVTSRETIGSPKKTIEYVVFLGADYSDCPVLLPNLLGPIVQNQADFVVGSRLLGIRQGSVTPLQRVSVIKVACLLMNWIWGASYTDLNPFCAIRFDALNRLQMRDVTHGWTVEMQVKAMQRGLRTVEVPVPFRPRIGEGQISGSGVRTIWAGFGILCAIAKYALFSRTKY